MCSLKKLISLIPTLESSSRWKKKFYTVSIYRCETVLVLYGLTAGWSQWQGSVPLTNMLLNREENILVFISGSTVKTFLTFTSFRIDFFMATRLSWQHNSTSLKGKETASCAFHWSNWCVFLCTRDFV